MTDHSSRPLRVAIYSAIFGRYDSVKLQPHQKNIATDFILFTDQDMLSPSWRVVPVPPAGNARLQAKEFKLLPQKFSELSGYDYTIWVDGSFQIERSDFVDWAIAQVGKSGMAMFAHHESDCLYDEAKDMADRAKYRDMPIYEQVAHYRAQGCPEKNGLYACGLIVRDMRNPDWQDTCESWWQENKDWTLRDQISLPYVLWKNGKTIDVIQGSIRASEYFSVHNDHRAHEYERKEIL